MADEADIAFDFQERHLNQALAAQRKTGTQQLKPTGCCHNCGNKEGISQRLFCDADCAEDWEYQDQVRRKLGLPMTSMGTAAADSPPAVALT